MHYIYKYITIFMYIYKQGNYIHTIKIKISIPTTPPIQSFFHTPMNNKEKSTDIYIYIYPYLKKLQQAIHESKPRNTNSRPLLHILPTSRRRSSRRRNRPISDGGSIFPLWAEEKIPRTQTNQLLLRPQTFQAKLGIVETKGGAI